MIDKITYNFVLFLTKIIMILPKKIRRAFFRLLANITYTFYSKNKKVILANLKHVYGDTLNKQEIQDIQKSCYQKLFLTVLSMIENPTFSKKQIETISSFENRHIIDKLQSENQQFIYFTGHLGNLDTMGVILGHHFGSTTHVQKKVNNKYLTNYMIQQREKYGIKVVDKKGAVRALYKALKNNEIVSLVVDQNIDEKYGTEVDFLGQKAFQTLTPAILSRKFNIPLLPIFIVGEDDNYKIIFDEPIYPNISNDKDKDIQEMTQAQADIISKMILKYPHEWFWCHKRFKNSTPSLYQ